MTVQYDPELCAQLASEARGHAAALSRRCECAVATYKCDACPKCVAEAWCAANLCVMPDQLDAARAEVDRLTKLYELTDFRLVHQQNATQEVSTSALADLSRVIRNMLVERDAALAEVAKLREERDAAGHDLANMQRSIEVWCSELETSEASRIRALVDRALVDQEVIQLRAEVERLRGDVRTVVANFRQEQKEHAGTLLEKRELEASIGRLSAEFDAACPSCAVGPQVEVERYTVAVTAKGDSLSQEAPSQGSPQENPAATIRRLRQRLYVVEPVYRAAVRLHRNGVTETRELLDRVERAVAHALDTEREIAEGVFAGPDGAPIEAPIAGDV